MSESQEKTLLIVGAGHAAGELATSARNEGWVGRIVMIGEEPHLPYQRPPLSKAFLAGEVAVEGLLLKPQATYDKAGVEFIGAARVTQIDRANKRVVLADGRTLAYDKLALTTGGRARRLTVDGAAQAESVSNFHYLRTLADVSRIRPQFTAGMRLVIIGGGYVGLEVAAVAVKHKLQVTVLESFPRVLARVTAPEVSAFYEQVHRAAGVELRTGVTVNGFEFDPSGDAVSAVVCGDGTKVAADLVIVGVGLVPNVELAEAAGLKVDNGIFIDEGCRTSDPDIVAAGDCTSQFNTYADRVLRLESVPSALEQARTAAASLNGKTRAQNHVPWFWSDQYDLKLQMVGLSQGYDQLVLRGKPDNRSFAAFYLKQGRVISVDVVNRPPDFMMAKRFVADGLAVDPVRLADESIPLKSLLPA